MMGGKSRNHSLRFVCCILLYHKNNLNSSYNTFLEKDDSMSTFWTLEDILSALKRNAGHCQLRRLFDEVNVSFLEIDLLLCLVFLGMWANKVTSFSHKDGMDDEMYVALSGYKICPFILARDQVHCSNVVMHTLSLASLSKIHVFGWSCPHLQ